MQQGAKRVLGVKPCIGQGHSGAGAREPKPETAGQG